MGMDGGLGWAGVPLGSSGCSAAEGRMGGGRGWEGRSRGGGFSRGAGGGVCGGKLLEEGEDARVGGEEGDGEVE